MKTRYFALIVGILFVVIGLLGFVPALVASPGTAPAITAKAGYGYLFNLFAINYWHNIVHLIVGLLGIVAYRSFRNARLFAQGLTIFYGLLAVLGLFPATHTLFGLMPIFGNDFWLHALTAIVATYFGFVLPRERTVVAEAVSHDV
jgi:hypothetical protein